MTDATPEKLSCCAPAAIATHATSAALIQAQSLRIGFPDAQPRRAPTSLQVTGFADSPDQGAGLARDMIVRWALEEAGQPYELRLVAWEDFKKPAHRKRQPFGQIPTYEEGDLV